MATFYKLIALALLCVSGIGNLIQDFKGIAPNYPDRIDTMLTACFFAIMALVESRASRAPSTGGTTE